MFEYQGRGAAEIGNDDFVQVQLLFSGSTLASVGGLALGETSPTERIVARHTVGQSLYRRLEVLPCI